MISDDRIDELSREMVKGRKSVNWLAYTIAAEVRKDDESLIRQMLEALETCGDGDGYNGPYQYYETVPVEEAVAAARARLIDSDLSKLTERGAKAWAGVDPQKLREGKAL